MPRPYRAGCPYRVRALGCTARRRTHTAGTRPKGPDTPRHAETPRRRSIAGHVVAVGICRATLAEYGDIRLRRHAATRRAPRDNERHGNDAGQNGRAPVGTVGFGSEQPDAGQNGWTPVGTGGPAQNGQAPVRTSGRRSERSVCLRAAGAGHDKRMLVGTAGRWSGRVAAGRRGCPAQAGTPGSSSAMRASSAATSGSCRAATSKSTT